MPNIDPNIELSLKYDKMFDNNYNMQISLDKKIILNESLIKQNITDFEVQNVQNNSLRIIVISIFIIFIVVLLYRLKVFDSPMILTIIIIAIIVLTMLLIYYLYYMYDYKSYLNRVSRNTSKLFTKNTIPIGNELDCTDEELDIADIKSLSNSQSLQPNHNKLLKDTETNFDVWKNGDHKSSNNINNNNVKNVDLDMNNYRYIDSLGISTDVTGKFDSLPDSSTTYYDCEYAGANPNGIPMQNRYIKSTIPCNYYIDYKENGKFVKNESSTYNSIKSKL